MIRLFTLFTLLLFLSTTAYPAQHYTGTQADKIVKGADEVWFKTDGITPSYIHFNNEFNLDEVEVLSWLKAEFYPEGGTNFIHLRTYESTTGVKHSAFNIVYENVPVEFMRLTVHSKNGRVESISGNILPTQKINNSMILTNQDALKIALDAIGSATYKWQDAQEETWLKDQTKDPLATYLPSGEFVILSKDADYRNLDLRYAFKFDVFSQTPVGREHIYIDAQNGEILFRHNLIHEADSVGTAHTGFSGVRQIISKRNGNQFSLHEEGRKIHTWDLNTSTSIPNRVDFFDADNIWQYGQGDLDQYALDAHWGAEMTHDYFLNSFQRNGIDNAGFEMNVYVHYDEAYSNAFWNGQAIHLGDGLANPYSTIDIIGHEITHGLTSFTASLIYKNESGALNESFSDIFGNCIEYYGKPNNFSWRIGEDRGGFIRDMSAPNLGAQPDTYGGLHWYTGNGDNGGVHTNSGVQNHWFYLLSEGGNGINDKGKSFNVNGIGKYNAAWIAYETLTAYLNPTSDYEEVYFYSIVAALDSFKRCDVQHAAIVNAWYAVGLGDEFIDHAVASFTADRFDFCAAPFTVNFDNASVNAVNYSWDFGDGATSTLESPSHTFNTAGEYTVSLSVSGGELCGTDEIVRQDLIKGLSLVPPTVQNKEIKISDGISLDITATSSEGLVYWFADEAETEILHIGTTYTTPKLYNDVKYFVKTVVSGKTSEIGGDIQSSLANGRFSNSNISILFDVKQDAELQSVKVNAGSVGERKFVIQDENGNVVFEKSVVLEKGIQDVVLSAHLIVGANYSMNVSGSNINLWRSDDATYPYVLPGVIEITGNSMGISTVYPYLFDWKVKEEDCTSGTETITVSIENNPIPNNSPYNFYVNNSTDFKYYLDLYFDEETTVSYGLYGISGQMITEFTKEYSTGLSTEFVNDLFNLSNNPSGVYFISIQGGKIEKTEKIVNKGGSN